MQEVEKAIGNIKRILSNIKPGLEKYDRLFYYGVISLEPQYSFLKFLAAVGAGGVILNEKDIIKLAHEFIRSRQRLREYRPTGGPLKDVRFQIRKIPHKFYSDKRDLLEIVKNDDKERELRKRLASYLNDLGVYGSVERREPVTYYSDIDVERWDPVKVLVAEATTGIPVSVSPLGRSTKFLLSSRIFDMMKAFLKLIPCKSREKIVKVLVHMLLKNRYSVLLDLVNRYHNINRKKLEVILKYIE